MNIKLVRLVERSLEYSLNVVCQGPKEGLFVAAIDGHPDGNDDKPNFYLEGFGGTVEQAIKELEMLLNDIDVDSL